MWTSREHQPSRSGHRPLRLLPSLSDDGVCLSFCSGVGMVCVGHTAAGFWWNSCHSPAQHQLVACMPPDLPAVFASAKGQACIWCASRQHLLGYLSFCALHSLLQCHIASTCNASWRKVACLPLFSQNLILCLSLFLQNMRLCLSLFSQNMLLRLFPSSKIMLLCRVRCCRSGTTPSMAFTTSGWMRAVF